MYISLFLIAGRRNANLLNEIVLIAPYEKMRQDACTIIRKKKYTNVSVVSGDLTEGLAAASKAVDEGAQVLISRGGTYSLIEYVSPVPVVEIKISIFDMMDTIRKLLATDKTVGIIGYSNVMTGCELLQELGKKVIRVELTHKEDVAEKIQGCGAPGTTVIVGDAVTCRIGRSLGYTCYLMESGEKSLENAIEEALRILSAITREKELLDRYRTLIDSVHDAVLATDENNTIIAVNRPACRILGLASKNIVGRTIDVLKSAGSVIDEIKNDKALTDEIRQMGTTKIEINNFPITIGEKKYGSVAVFQDIAEVQTREQNIRLKLVRKGFIAKYSFATIIHKSKKISDCIAIAKKISKYDSSVLIEGESGVGKELFAQSIHNESCRRHAPFVAVNCAALPSSLIESVLFGYEEGSFTGSKKGGREGVFELAHTGTLFLDEIGELPVELQGRLLRVIQEHEIMRIGGTAIIPVDVRLICATNRNLKRLIAEGKFRRDLLYRLNTLGLYIPSLNERPEDIPVLATAFLHRYSGQYAKMAVGFTPAAVDFLQTYTYEGNIRELQNMVERAVIISEGEKITIHDLSAGLPSASGVSGRMQEFGPAARSSVPAEQLSDPAAGSLKQIEEQYIRQVFSKTGKSVTESCRILGINRSTLWRKLRQ
jgi:PAS domain S-box-containing protein